LKVGQEVKVKVIAVDQERKRIGLSIRQLLPDPWVVRVSSLKEGQLVEGTITHLTKFGAFAKLDEDMEGLIHISELSEQRINHPKEVVKEGDVVTLRVIKLDAERRRIGLSLRKVDSMAYANMDYEMMLSGQAKTDATPAEEESVETMEAPTEEAVAEEPASLPEEALAEEPVSLPEETAAEEPASLPEATVAEEPASLPEVAVEEEPSSLPEEAVEEESTPLTEEETISEPKVEEES
jgi:small subunit ribosomal protein S1